MEDNSNAPIDDENLVSKPAAITTSDTAKKRPKLLIPVVAGLVLLLAGGATALYTSSQNSPDKIWSTALSRTADGLDKIIEKSNAQQSEGGKLNGSFKIESPVVVDGSVTGQFDQSNADFSGDIGFSGVRATYEVRAIASAPDETPDIYMMVDGLQGLDSLLGSFDPQVGDLVNQVNGSWYFIDHTLIDQALLSQSSNEASSQVSPEELTEIGNKTASVLRDRLFTDDKQKAVVVIKEPVGEEEFEGDNTYKYKVTVQKDQLKQFVTEMKNALSETKLKELVLQGSSDSASFEDILNFDQLLSSIDEADFSDVEAEVWINLETKVIRNIRIKPTNLEEGESAYVDFGLDYDGGDDLPFKISFFSEGASDGSGLLEMTLNFNQVTNAIKLGLNVDIESDGQDIRARGELTIETSDEQLNLEKPENAKNIYELLGLALGGYSGASGGFDDFSNSDDFNLDLLPIDDVEL